MELKFDEKGLIPVIVQDHYTKEVLTLAYMNAETLALTIAEKRTVFWSRSRQEIWRKGETSGNTQQVVSITADCDGDALVVEVSSFQLEHAASFHPQAAILLNVTPDHLDRHGSLERYAALKAGLLENLLPGGVAVYHAALEGRLRLPPECRRARLWLAGEEV